MCKSVTALLSFAPLLLLIFISSFFQFPGKEKDRVATLNLLMSKSLPLNLHSLSLGLLVGSSFGFHFLLANYPVFPSIYLCRGLCIPLFCCFCLSTSQELVSTPFLRDWAQAQRSVLPASLPAVKLLRVRPSQGLASLNGCGGGGGVVVVWLGLQSPALSAASGPLARWAGWSPLWCC